MICYVYLYKRTRFFDSLYQPMRLAFPKQAKCMTRLCFRKKCIYFTAKSLYATAIHHRIQR